MKRNMLTILAVVVIIIGLFGFSSFYTVHMTQQALVLQFGDPVRVVTEPGLKLKIPFAQNVVFMEKRILDFDVPKQEIIASDKKRLVVDAYSRFRIADPLRFYQAVGTENRARSRLSDIITSGLRKILARVELQTILSSERADLMQEISRDVNVEARKMGLEIVDVRVMRADLPEANSQAVFQRMQSERNREAREARARGAEENQKIKAESDRKRTVLLAEASKQAEILRGQGEGLSKQIIRDATKQDPEFYSFYLALQSYREALNPDDTTMVLSPDMDFFRYFGDITGGAPKRGD